MNAVPDYALHSLGWYAFQQLCGTILREVWGQTFQVFAECNDAGRDGAFYGKWISRDGSNFAGSTTVQCKFSSRLGKSISLSELSDELEKATHLARAGLADNYVLITNCSISASTEAEIAQKFQTIPGIKKCACYGKTWVCSVIAENMRLRMLVPRLYGLGDLTQILDERAYDQARAILSSMGDELGKFVITQAHRDSVEAINKHRFVLLLGEPACGKSTIASALALGAADQWGSQLVKIESPKQFTAHWNPKDPRQFFWIDDAFGQTQYERHRALEWNHAFPGLVAAIKQGVAVVFTSRDYIYRAALDDLKEEAFPLLREGQVVIQVQDLSSAEKEQILYNHIKLGNQPAKFRSAIKQLLPKVTQNRHFLPEIARRLGDRFFTADLSLDEASVLRFVEEPQQFLCDIIRRLDNSNRAALAMIFMRGGKLPSLRKLELQEQEALVLLSATLGDVRRALSSLKGTLVTHSRESGQQSWRFKHPTIRDAFGSLIAQEPELIDVYLAGTKIDSLLTEVTCGQMKIKGVKLVVSEDQWPMLIKRLGELNVENTEEADELYQFLANRCSSEFLKLFLNERSDLVASLEYSSWMRYDAAVNLASRLNSCRLLSEVERQRFVKAAKSLIFRHCDAGFLEMPKIRAVFRKQEMQDILAEAKVKLAPKLRSMVAARRRQCIRNGSDPDNVFWSLQRNIGVFRSNLSFDWTSQDRFFKAYHQINRHLQSLSKKRKNLDDLITDSDSSVQVEVKSRSIFDDVDVL